MASVELAGVAKKYPNGYVAVEDFNIEIADKEFIILVGPSGCGKSTTMRMIAGLEEATGGEIRIDGRRVNELPPKDRDIAMVFQDYALYPHMTVRENMSLSLKLKKNPPAEINKRIREVAAILDLEGVLERRPRELSGGQRQRVALGRAIVRTPRVFMFDEPLSNLDPKLRTTMRVELKKLHQRLQTTMIYVTHDQVEAMTLGDRIIVMDGGAIQQVDTPINIYRHPANKFVAGFIGSPPMNFFRCEFRETPEGLILEGSGVQIPVPREHGHFQRLRAGFPGTPVVDVGVRAESMRVRPLANVAGGKGEGRTTAVLEVKEPVSPEVFLHLKAGELEMVVREDGQVAENLRVGDTLAVEIDLDTIHLFDTRGERNLANELD